MLSFGGAIAASWDVLGSEEGFDEVRCPSVFERAVASPVQDPDCVDGTCSGFVSECVCTMLA
jgi:hypothetical protein